MFVFTYKLDDHYRKRILNENSSQNDAKPILIVVRE